MLGADVFRQSLGIDGTCAGQMEAFGFLFGMAIRCEVLVDSKT